MKAIQNKELSPQAYARIGGVLYLLIIALGIFYELIVRNGIRVPGDALATMTVLKENELLWRFGIAAELLSSIAGLGLVLILYRLTQPISKDLALLAAFFNFSAITVQTAYILQLVETLFPLSSSVELQAFSSEQLGAMVMLSMKSHAFGFGIALLMFGPYFLITGYLIFKSTYLPRYIGILYMISGLGYLINSFTLILAPTRSGIVFMIILLPVFIGEVSLALTLLFKGVNITQWSSKIRESQNA